ncbi:MAG: plasmid mobilization relaxosome protein MobC [Bacteroidetes bacterium]|nr:plasmid mobilization relaxosome protein MobC [Bacteroidota bacterium]
MGRKPASEEKRLKYRLTTHVNEKKHRQLQELLRRSGKMDMSTLIRNILEGRQIRIYVHDETMDMWLEELGRLRGEVRHIGVNINQITRHFNTYPEPFRKATYAKMAFEEYLNLQPQIEAIWVIVKKLSEKWLSA